MLRIPYLARLRARKRPSFEFPFCLEPIIQVAAWLFATVEISYARRLMSSSRAAFPTEASGVSACMEVVWGCVIPFLLDFDDMLISLVFATGLLLVVEACLRLRSVQPASKKFGTDFWCHAAGRAL
jgi:hypothetical protein